MLTGEHSQLERVTDLLLQTSFHQFIILVKTRKRPTPSMAKPPLQPSLSESLGQTKIFEWAGV